MRTPDGDMVSSLPGPLQLAYLGDAVWELHVRRSVLQAGSGKPDQLHRRAVRRVQASAQARVLQELEPFLGDEEKEMVRRGRNAKGHVPRGADPLDYRYSTAFECLLGYLYFTGRMDRLEEVLRYADVVDAAVAGTVDAAVAGAAAGTIDANAADAAESADEEECPRGH